METPAHLDWLRLVGAIDSWAQSALPRDGDIAVTLADERTVTVVMTPADLDDMYVAFGVFSDICNYVIKCLASVPAECDFLVYDGSYDLEPHTARNLPRNPGCRRSPAEDGTRSILGRAAKPPLSIRKKTRSASPYPRQSARYCRAERGETRSTVS